MNFKHSFHLNLNQNGYKCIPHCLVVELFPNYYFNTFSVENLTFKSLFKLNLNFANNLWNMNKTMYDQCRNFSLLTPVKSNIGGRNYEILYTRFTIRAATRPHYFSWTRVTLFNPMPSHPSSPQVFKAIWALK